MIHGKGAGITVAFDIYKELAEGRVKKAWKIDKLVDFYRFREKLSRQSLTYCPRNRCYPGDDKFRVSTQQKLSKRQLPSAGLSTPRSPTPGTPRSAASVASSSTSGITPEDVKQEQQRLCGDLTQLTEHYESLQHLPNKNKKVCSLCGILCQHICGKCGKAMHHPGTTNEKVKHPCFIQWHNTMFFGLAKDDFRFVGSKKKDYDQPSAEKVVIHSVAMKRMKAEAISAHGNDAVTPLRNKNNNNNNNKNKRRRLTGDNNGQEEWNDRCL